VIYLDPMYPEEGRSESALPKKAMQMFRKLVGDDLDATAAFTVALKVARERVVVKRPGHALPLGGREPTHRFEGKTARYDMYLV
jgi:16S rRNA (guanine1516-N2)-methyltransferase